MLCFAVLAGDWQAADRKRLRVASDHIVIARIHGELLRLHILGTPPWLRILLSVFWGVMPKYHLYTHSCKIQVAFVMSGCCLVVCLLLWCWCDAPFCQHTMGFIGIDMHRCLPAPNHISIYNFAIASCRLGVQFNHLVKYSHTQHLENHLVHALSPIWVRRTHTSCGLRSTPVIELMYCWR